MKQKFKEFPVFCVERCRKKSPAALKITKSSKYLVYLIKNAIKIAPEGLEKMWRTNTTLIPKSF